MTCSRSLRASLIALSVAAVMETGGCSWIFVKPLPPNYDVGDPVDCTSNEAAPVIDVLVVVSNIMGILYVASRRNSQNQDRVDALIGGQVTGLILWGTSAGYGYRNTNACSAAERAAGLSYPHHLGVVHRPYLPAQPVGPPLAAPAPVGAQPAPVVTPLRAPAPQQGDDEKPSLHSPPPPKPWTLPQED